ncbi:MAG TPA: SRPBCC family protein [Devosia sp.]|nr:SRPBCC family protein [Devosia sp.]
MGIWSAELAEMMGVGHGAFYAFLGIGLIMFAATLTLVAYRPTPFLVLMVVAADIGWLVSTSAAALLLGSSLTTAVGTLITVNVVVAAMALLQYRSILAFFATQEGSSEQFQIRLCAPVPVPAESLWPVLSDLGAIQRFMPSLKSSVLSTGDVSGVGSVRTCESLSGQTWSERCDRWTEGKSFEMTFLTDETGFPYPFERMRGGWEISPAQGGSMVAVWWRVTPHHPMLAGLLLPMMLLGLRRSMAQVIDNMAAAAGGGAGKRRRLTASAPAMLLC